MAEVWVGGTPAVVKMADGKAAAGRVDSGRAAGDEQERL